MIEGTRECYSQSASHARSFIKDLRTPPAEDGLDPYSLLAIYFKNEDLTPLFSSKFNRHHLLSYVSQLNRDRNFGFFVN